LVDIIRTPDQLRRVIIVLLIVGAMAALIGIVLWVLPDQIAETSLSKLAIIGYPNTGIIQYVEQNPDLPERAIGTSVNPNSLGGFLVMVAALAAPQIMTRSPATGRRWHSFILLAILVGCLVLTFSRGSMAAFGIALLFSAALRYRRLVLILIVIGLIIVILPWSQPYVQRFAEGLKGADLATQMRFGEYSDALILVSRYPLLGVGFSGAPDIDIYLGVASVYLTIAENMGLIGLAAFGLVMLAVISYAWKARPYLDGVKGLRPIWLGLMAGLLGALVGGLADHYFFNLEFQHAIAIFWIFVGLLLATTRIALETAPKKAYHSYAD
jgi:O-antigen ligase